MLATSRAQVRSPSPPSHVRGRRNAGSFHFDCQAENLPRLHTSKWFYLMNRDLLIPRGTRGCSGPISLTPCQRLRDLPRLSRRRGTPEGCDPSRWEVPAAASGQSQTPVPETSVGSWRTVPPNFVGTLRRA